MAFGQSGTFQTIDYKPEGIVLDSLSTVYGFMVSPEFKYSNGNEHTPTIDDVRDFVKGQVPQYVFEGYVSNFKVIPNFKGKIVECSIRVKYWKENYTFNEFRKLIYE